MPGTATHAHNRWWLFWAIAIAVSLSTLAAMMTQPPGVPAIRLAIRATARTSLLLFCAAFVASALAGWWRGRVTRALLAYRRQIGLGFAFSHAVHLAAIIAFARVAPVQFDATTSIVTYLGGGLGYVFIAAMAATSFDRSARWIGARRWRLLHGVGGYYVWIIFANSYGRRALHDGFYRPMLALLVVAMVTKLAWLVRQRMVAAKG
jgi:DMSO/TMAO reductase YedYZ heme-binding membrane subunit